MSPVYESAPDALLINILREYKNYSDSEVKAAYEELSRRGLLENALNLIRDEMKREQSAGQKPDKLDSSPEFDAAVYKSFQAGSRGQVLFESKLIAMGIPFYRRDGLTIFVPMVHYYFAKNDFPVADKLEAETWEMLNQPAEARSYDVEKGTKKGVVFVLIVAVIFASIALIINWFKK